MKSFDRQHNLKTQQNGNVEWSSPNRVNASIEVMAHQRNIVQGRSWSLRNIRVRFSTKLGWCPVSKMHLFQIPSNRLLIRKNWQNWGITGAALIWLLPGRKIWKANRKWCFPGLAWRARQKITRSQPATSGRKATTRWHSRLAFPILIIPINRTVQVCTEAQDSRER